MIKFSIIIVAFNSAEVIGDTLESIPAGHEVIVVDNASTDKSLELARRHGAVTVPLDKNHGFGVACNLGAKRATSDFLLFLNPDAVPDKDALEKLLEAFVAYPDTAALNPRLIDAQDKQYFRRRNQFLPRTGYKRVKLPTGDREISILSGAALAIRKAAFTAVGGFDENIFLYYEDDDLSASLTKAGFILRYIHGAVVRHTAGRSSPSSPDMTFFREYHAIKSKRYVMAKYELAF